MVGGLLDGVTKAIDLTGLSSILVQPWVQVGVGIVATLGLEETLRKLRENRERRKAVSQLFANMNDAKYDPGFVHEAFGGKVHPSNEEAVRRLHHGTINSLFRKGRSINTF